MRSFNESSRLFSEPCGSCVRMCTVRGRDSRNIGTCPTWCCGAAAHAGQIGGILEAESGVWPEATTLREIDTGWWGRQEKKQAKAYSGPGKAVRDKKVALQELLRLDFATFTACKAASGQVYVRCKEQACRKPFNGLNFASWLPHVAHNAAASPLSSAGLVQVRGVEEELSLRRLASVLFHFHHNKYTSSRRLYDLCICLIFTHGNDRWNEGHCSDSRQRLQAVLPRSEKCLRCHHRGGESPECENAISWNN